MATQNKQNPKQLFRQQPHYGLRKLSIGVASVLLSTSFYLGVTAHAATSDNGATNPVTQKSQSESSSNANASSVILSNPTPDDSPTPTQKVVNKQIVFKYNYPDTGKTDTVATQQVNGHSGEIKTVTDTGKNESIKLAIPTNWELSGEYNGHFADQLNFSNDDPLDVFLKHQTKDTLLTSTKNLTITVNGLPDHYQNSVYNWDFSNNQQSLVGSGHQLVLPIEIEVTKSIDLVTNEIYYSSPAYIIDGYKLLYSAGSPGLTGLPVEIPWGYVATISTSSSDVTHSYSDAGLFAIKGTLVTLVNVGQYDFLDYQFDSQKLTDYAQSMNSFLNGGLDNEPKSKVIFIGSQGYQDGNSVNPLDQFVDENLTINVKPIELTKDYYFVDQDGKLVGNGKPHSFKGTMDSTVDVHPKLPDGWELVDPTQANFDYSFSFPYELSNKKDDSSGLKLHKTVLNSEPLLIPIRHKITQSSETTTITRPITVHSPNGTIIDATQTMTLSRPLSIDEVTNKPTSKGVWSTGSFDQYDAPVILGYTATRNAAATNVTINSSLSPIDISYLPNKQTGKISYLDHGQEVGSTPLFGKTDELVAINPVIPDGYTIIPGQTIPTSIQATADGIPTVVIQVQHPTPAVTDHSTNSEMPKTTLVTPIPTISNATKSNIQKENNEVATKLTTAPSNRHQSQLPQTGTNDNDVIVGLALAGLASVLGLTGIQKRKDN